MLADLLKKCGHRDDDFIEYWDGQWVMSQLDVIVTVNIAYPVLIRLRPTLIEPLTDCPGLDDELKLQPRAMSKNKRAAATVVSPMKAPRLDSYSTAPETIRKDEPRATDIVINSRSPSPVAPTLPLLARGKTPSVSSQPRGLAPFPLDLGPLAKHSKSTTSQKAWPRDYHVCEVIEGLKLIGSKMDKGGSQSAAFAEVFHGAKYHKGQMSGTRRILSRAGAILQDRFDNFGRSSRGTWKAFKAYLPNSIADKAFSDEQAIRDLEEAGSKREEDVDENDIEITSPCINGLSLRGNSGLQNHGHDVDETSSQISDESDLYDGPRCSFCDQALDFSPSDTLISMREVLQDQSKPDPIPCNPGHRKAKSVTMTLEYCERHRLEADIFPIAQTEGWPVNIDFSKLHARILALDNCLRPLLMHENIKDNEFYQAVQETFAPGTSLASASGINGQWTSFKGHGAG
jgi:hypothetical protein